MSNVTITFNKNKLVESLTKKLYFIYLDEHSEEMKKRDPREREIKQAMNASATHALYSIAYEFNITELEIMERMETLDFDETE